MIETIYTIFSTIFGFAFVTAGATGSVLFLVKLFGEKWIQNIVDRDIEKYRHDLSIAQTRNILLHKKEYEIFPEVWQKLNASFNAVGGLIGRSRIIPNFSAMNQERMSQWIGNQNFSTEEYDYFVSSSDKQKSYNRILDSRDIENARTIFHDFHTFYMNNRIFIRKSVTSEIDKIDKLMVECWALIKTD
ncbi:MAG: hypothetical protein ACK5V0_11050, partial [Alphaproteobacteria bacterium]